MKKFRYFTKAKSEKGITLIALIVTIIVLIIIAGISIATLTADNGVLRQTNLAKVENIEGTAREQVKLAVGAMRLAIAEAQSLDNSYKASDNTSAIQAKLLEVIRADTTALEKDGWSSADDTANSFKITYAGDDYKQACNNTDAEIVYTITLGQKSIEITNETNATLKDQNGNDVTLDIGGSTGAGTGNGSGSGSGEGSGGGTQEPVALEAGLYQTGTKTLLKSWDTLISEGILDSNGKIVSGQETNLAGDLVLPNTMTAVPYKAYYNCTALTDVTIPDSVTSIAQSAFYNCTSLTDITIPSRMTSTGSLAFSGCTNLKTVYYEGTIEQWCNISFDSNPCYNKAILYVNGELVENVVIPDTVTEIKANVFNGCTSLKNITIPDSVTIFARSNYGGIFQNCINLTSVTFGKNSQLAAISKIMFAGCINLTNIEIPDTVTSIGSNAFSGCTSLASVTIPGGVTSMGEYAFASCTNLKTVYYKGTLEQWCNTTFNALAGNPCSNGAILYIDGELVENITLSNTKSYIFDGCTSLKSVIISDGVTSIERFTFSGCRNITTITIPDSVTSVGENAFFSCTNLNTVYYEGIIEQWCNISFGNASANPFYAYRGSDGKVYINGELIENIIIPDTATEIKAYIFYKWSSLKTVIIPDGVTSIGERAFYYCTNLTSVTISDSVTTIGEYAFYGCASLTSVTIPDGVTGIGSSAFAQCSKLANVTILATEPPTLDSNTVVQNCSSSLTITVPAGCADAYKAASGWSSYASKIVEAQ